MGGGAAQSFINCLQCIDVEPLAVGELCAKHSQRDHSDRSMPIHCGCLVNYGRVGNRMGIGPVTLKRVSSELVYELASSQ